MSNLGTFRKQTNEVVDVNFDFSQWLEGKNDTIASQSVSTVGDLVVLETSQSGGVVKAFIGGGTNGSQYKVSCTITTARTPTARVKDAEITVYVKND